LAPPLSHSSLQELHHALVSKHFPPGSSRRPVRLPLRRSEGSLSSLISRPLSRSAQHEETRVELVQGVEHPANLSLPQRHSSKLVEVELTQDVPSLGRRGERVPVSPGVARNRLLPARQALYVVRGEAISPLQRLYRKEAERAGGLASVMAKQRKREQEEKARRVLEELSGSVRSNPSFSHFSSFSPPFRRLFRTSLFSPSRSIVLIPSSFSARPPRRRPRRRIHPHRHPLRPSPAPPLPTPHHFPYFHRPLRFRLDLGRPLPPP